MKELGQNIRLYTPEEYNAAWRAGEDLEPGLSPRLGVPVKELQDKGYHSSTVTCALDTTHLIEYVILGTSDGVLVIGPSPDEVAMLVRVQAGLKQRT